MSSIDATRTFIENVFTNLIDPKTGKFDERYIFDFQRNLKDTKSLRGNIKIRDLYEAKKDDAFFFEHYDATVWDLMILLFQQVNWVPAFFHIDLGEDVDPIVLESLEAAKKDVRYWLTINKSFAQIIFDMISFATFGQTNLAKVLHSFWCDNYVENADMVAFLIYYGTKYYPSLTEDALSVSSTFAMPGRKNTSLCVGTLFHRVCMSGEYIPQYSSLYNALVSTLEYEELFRCTVHDLAHQQNVHDPNVHQQNAHEDFYADCKSTNYEARYFDEVQAPNTAIHWLVRQTKIKPFFALCKRLSAENCFDLRVGQYIKYLLKRNYHLLQMKQSRFIYFKLSARREKLLRMLRHINYKLSH